MDRSLTGRDAFAGNKLSRIACCFPSYVLLKNAIVLVFITCEYSDFCKSVFYVYVKGRKERTSHKGFATTINVIIKRD